MKKTLLFTFGLFLIFLSGSAQNLVISTSGHNLANGDTVTVSGPSTNTLHAMADVTNNGATALSVVCRRKVIQTLPGSTNSICWGGQCWPPDTVQTPDFTVIDPGATTTEFMGDFSPAGAEGTAIIRYTFFDIANTNDSVCFMAKFVSTANAGVSKGSNSLSVSSIYPNPSDKAGFIEYRLQESGSTAKVIINDMIGNEVRVIPLQEKEGKIRIATNDMPEGVYFYSFVINGKVHYTKKLVVAHN
ncbi:MAG TPA: T9SS type A sorting domain-containing protein [Bacteroidales bacterium]|nr:T9SS type A sorting domain-containing protein [Bacteroidales bacterium]